MPGASPFSSLGIPSMLARDLVWNCPSDEECAGLDNYLFELVTVGQHALLNELSTKLSARRHHPDSPHGEIHQGQLESGPLVSVPKGVGLCDMGHERGCAVVDRFITRSAENALKRGRDGRTQSAFIVTESRVLIMGCAILTRSAFLVEPERKIRE